MPWKERTVKAMREEFMNEFEKKQKNMSELCREYGISRQTGYKWKKRYDAEETMEDRSKTPKIIPHRTAKETEQKVVEIREQYPSMGAAKIHRIMVNRGEQSIPCVRTINNIMKRNGLISREASEAATPYHRFEYAEPNDMWQMDFKGYIKIGNEEKCYPLNIIDDCSRFLICSRACHNETLEEISESITESFRQYGLPKIILCDNGNPWGTAQQSGFTRFEVWMMELGILVKHGRGLHPQTQGKVERFNESLNKEALRQHVFSNFSQTQTCLDEYRERYNNERPHQSLDLETPGSVYHKSSRTMPEKIKEWKYGQGYTFRVVRDNGCFSLNGQVYFLSYAFAGKTIAIRESKIHGLLTIEFRQFRIARFDPATRKFVSKKAELLSESD